MDIFQRAKVFRLKCSSQSKYLIAHKDEETVKLTRDNSSNNARWSYELVEGKPNVIRLRSCCTWRYLAATEDPFVPGMTGKKIVQTISQGPTIEWEIIREGLYIKLQSHRGSTLIANRGIPPWRNAVTHDDPGHWTGTESMALWIVDMIVIDYQSSKMGNRDTTDACSSIQDSTDSDSFIEPKYRLASRDDSNKVNVNKANGAESKNPAQSTLGYVQPFEVKKARQTFERLKSADFDTILSSGQSRRLEKAVDVLITDAKATGRSKVPSKLTNIQQQLKSMKNDHQSATHDLAGFTTFSTKRSVTKAELKKYVAKARELEKAELELTNRVIHAKDKREELLKQLKEVENNIKDVEKSRSDNMVKVDELVSSIQKNSRRLRDIQGQEKSWQARKIEAERMQLNVENDWRKVTNMFQMFDNYQ